MASVVATAAAEVSVVQPTETGPSSFSPAASPAQKQPLMAPGPAAAPQPPTRAPRRTDITIKDFQQKAYLGDGSFSDVILARLKGDNKDVALKAMDKMLLVREKKVEAVKTERQILDRLDHPGVARLLYTFQSETTLYLAMEPFLRGELFDQIRLRRGLPLDAARQWAAEIVDILAYLRQEGVIHRDIKPENFLLDERAHLTLIDFGSAKEVGGPDPDGNSFVGTADYVPPELLDKKPVTPAADLWAFGCVLFQMLTGATPFCGDTEYLTLQRIHALDYALPSDADADAADLVRRLLVREPEERIGFADVGEVQRHAFFAGVDWGALREREGPEVVELPRAPRMGSSMAEGDSSHSIGADLEKLGLR
ncbi:unnamed protein product [Pedinophyceae sp. YPF-701]|nr:unnamed protein product [Pedinophyceae sp. YPF-701]